MNLQENIRRILREEYTVKQMKLLTIASQAGLLKTGEMFGGIEYLINVLGDEFFTTNNKIKNIILGMFFLNVSFTLSPKLKSFLLAVIVFLLK